LLLFLGKIGLINDNAMFTKVILNFQRIAYIYHTSTLLSKQTTEHTDAVAFGWTVRFDACCVITDVD
jgi:hypothetical protein